MALNFPNIDPVIVKFGPFDIFGQTFEPALRWYGFTYLVGFVAAMWLLDIRRSYWLCALLSF